MTKILFLCSGNSCRSQIAEGFARDFLDKKRRLEPHIHSAGIESHGVNPWAVRVMQELDIDISRQTSNSIDSRSMTEFDLVVTLCSNAEKSCPVLPSHTRKIHWPLPDPAARVDIADDHASILARFRDCRDEISLRVSKLMQQLIEREDKPA